MAKEVIALIPARANSKRIKGKNTRLLLGRPLIDWTISAALQSDKVDRVIVSTDCKNIKTLASKSGAEAPYLRPKELSTDTASTDDVMLHAVNKLSLSDDDIIVLLQPTSPLRNASHIEEALSLLSDSIEGVVSVCECEHSPLWTNTLPESGIMDGFLPEHLVSVRSQDLPVYYRLNGALYVYRVGYIKNYGKRVYTSQVKAYVMDSLSSVDIDNHIDFALAETILRTQQDT